MQLHRALEIFALHVLEQPDFDDPGVIDQNIERAEVVDDIADCLFDLRAIEQVTWDDRNIAAGFDEFIVRALQFSFVAREQDDARPVRAKLARQDQAQAPREPPVTRTTLPAKENCGSRIRAMPHPPRAAAAKARGRERFLFI